MWVTQHQIHIGFFLEFWKHQCLASFATTRCFPAVCSPSAAQEIWLRCPGRSCYPPAVHLTVLSLYFYGKSPTPQWTREIPMIFCPVASSSCLSLVLHASFHSGKYSYQPVSGSSLEHLPPPFSISEFSLSVRFSAPTAFPLESPLESSFPTLRV